MVRISSLWFILPICVSRPFSLSHSIISVAPFVANGVGGIGGDHSASIDDGTKEGHSEW